MNLFLDPVVVGAGAGVDSGVVGQGAAVAVGHNAGLDVGVGDWVQAHKGATRVSLHKWAEMNGVVRIGYISVQSLPTQRGRNERCRAYRLAYSLPAQGGRNERFREYRLVYSDELL